MSNPKPYATVGIFVGPHARERARERFPGFKAARIVQEVREAMTAGRISADKPAGMDGGRTDPEALYAWTEGCERIYVLYATDNTMVVATTLRGSPREVK